MTDRIAVCAACGAKNRMPASAAGRPACARCANALPWIVEAGDGDFDAVAAGVTSLPVLVDLWAPWCGPCRVVSPAVEAVASAMAGALKVVKVNVDAAPAIAARFNVRSIPTLLLLRNGQPVDRAVGARSASDLRRWVEQALAATSVPEC